MKTSLAEFGKRGLAACARAARRLPSWSMHWGWQLLILPLTLWRFVVARYELRYRYSHSQLGRRSFVPPQVIFLPLMFVPLFLGAVIGLDAPFLVAILSAMVFAVMVFVMLNATGMLLVMFVLTFLVQGSAMYFAHVRQAPWIAIGMAGLFFMRALLELTTKDRVVKAGQRSTVGSGVILALSVYLACYFFSFIVNRPPGSQMIGSIKATLPMIGVLFALYWFHWTTPRLENLWKLMIVIAVLQLPVVFYQHFFIASKRAFQGFDAVVGTFGGNQDAGGLSSIMVFFVIVAMGYMLARWNRGLSSGQTALLVAGTIVVVILLGEVKASFVWMPLTVFFVLRKRVMKNILTLIGYAVLAGAVVSAIFVAYNALYWQTLKSKDGTLREKIDQTSGYFFDARNVNYMTGEVSRGASLALWANDRNASLPRRLIGYGPGASKSGGSLGKGEVARRFDPLQIDATTAAVMLWDVGLMGASAYALMMLSGIGIAARFLWQGRGSERQKAIMEAALISTIMMLSMLIYNRSLTDEPTLQLLYLFMLGSIVQIARYPDEAMQVNQQTRRAERTVPRSVQWSRKRPPQVYPGKLVRD